MEDTKVVFGSEYLSSVAAVVFSVLPLFSYPNMFVAIPAALLALIGMMLYEHAYVQAGQSVPLA